MAKLIVWTIIACNCMNATAEDILMSDIPLMAIAQIETGATARLLEPCKEDFIVGKHGEVTRFQILPKVLGKSKMRHKRERMVMLTFVREELHNRIHKFQKRHQRPPTYQEVYVLWNNPACLIGPKPTMKPSKRVIERAKRFENIVEKIVADLSIRKYLKTDKMSTTYDWTKSMTEKRVL